MSASGASPGMSGSRRSARRPLSVSALSRRKAWVSPGGSPVARPPRRSLRPFVDERHRPASSPGDQAHGTATGVSLLHHGSGHDRRCSPSPSSRGCGAARPSAPRPLAYGVSPGSTGSAPRPSDASRSVRRFRSKRSPYQPTSGKCPPGNKWTLRKSPRPIAQSARAQRLKWAPRAGRTMDVSAPDYAGLRFKTVPMRYLKNKQSS